MISFTYVDPSPPPYLYLSDGGMTEDLGLLHLLRRRAKWMLVADAGDDEDLEMIDLKTSMRNASSEKLCSFFDLDEPKRSMCDVFESYRESGAPYLRLGVRYGWGPATSEDTGVVFIIRLRMPLHSVKRTVAPPIQEEELYRHARHWRQPGNAPPPGSIAQDDVGGCCCECCHEHCQICTGFPHIGTANQFFTPTLFSNYARLGYELADGAVDELLRMRHEARRE